MIFLFLIKNFQSKRFITEFVDPKGGKEYCSVYHKGEHVGVLMAREGWVTVKAPAGNREPRADQLEMVRLAEEAEKLNKGIHNKKVFFFFFFFFFDFIFVLIWSFSFPFFSFFFLFFLFFSFFFFFSFMWKF